MLLNNMKKSNPKLMGDDQPSKNEKIIKSILSLCIEAERQKSFMISSTVLQGAIGVYNKNSAWFKKGGKN